ncbi:GNAT family N-acetyltransferase [Streptomyces sp. AC512_CC834]|uniref:GNAT family N-acetyltransferase n=1 Tax=Streptomyces sp. AC512_CC834 TaxID=2823691 RepID=UPI001C2612F5|nr:GNAT family N-acetyltransferase [Streptomyces sp. AC512_CC834]
MTTISLRPARPSDLTFIGKLCARSSTVPAEGIGYPRCEDETELLAELALYDSSLEEFVHVVCDSEGAPVGFTGFLVSDTDDTTYVFGPLLDEAHHDSRTAAAALRLLTAVPTGGRVLFNYVQEENTVLATALVDSGWRADSRQLEMRYAVQEAPAPGTSGPGTPWIRALTDRDDAAFAAVSALLARQHHWSSDPVARLADYLDDGYQVAVAERDGQVAGCVLWIRVDDTDFARLDYLSVDEPHQRRSLGLALVRHTLEAVHAAEDIEYLYLNVDPLNETAHRLYLRCGFTDNVRIRKYVHDRD